MQIYEGRDQTSVLLSVAPAHQQQFTSFQIDKALFATILYMDGKSPVIFIHRGFLIKALVI